MREGGRRLTRGTAVHGIHRGDKVVERSDPGSEHSISTLRFLWRVRAAPCLGGRGRQEGRHAVIISTAGGRLGHHCHGALGGRRHLCDLGCLGGGSFISTIFKIVLSRSLADTWTGAGTPRLSGIMLSVWKLMGGVGVILSICWMPAWMAEISLSRPSKSSMALARAAGEAEAPSGKVAALEGMARGA